MKFSLFGYDVYCNICNLTSFYFITILFLFPYFLKGNSESEIEFCIIKAMFYSSHLSCIY